MARWAWKKNETLKIEAFSTNVFQFPRNDIVYDVIKIQIAQSKEANIFQQQTTRPELISENHLRGIVQ